MVSQGHTYLGPHGQGHLEKDKPEQDIHLYGRGCGRGRGMRSHTIRSPVSLSKDFYLPPEELSPLTNKISMWKKVINGVKNLTPEETITMSETENPFEPLGEVTPPSNTSETNELVSPTLLKNYKTTSPTLFETLNPKNKRNLKDSGLKRKASQTPTADEHMEIEEQSINKLNGNILAKTHDYDDDAHKVSTEVTKTVLNAKT